MKIEYLLKKHVCKSYVHDSLTSTNNRETFVSYFIEIPLHLSLEFLE